MSASAPQTIAVVGAGSWGTALALQLARAGCKVRLGGVVEIDLLEAMVEDRENRRYLPDAAFPPALTVHPDLADCLSGADDVLVVVPSHGLRDTLGQIKPLLGADTRVCWATKGFELMLQTGSFEDGGRIGAEQAEIEVGRLSGVRPSRRLSSRGRPRSRPVLRERPGRPRMGRGWHRG